MDKNHTLIDKLPIKMFHRGERFVPDSDIEKTIEMINKEIDVGYVVSKSYLGDKRYESSCQVKKPLQQERLCTIEALQVEKDQVTAQLKFLKITIRQLADQLYELDQNGPEYQHIEQMYFFHRIKVLMMERQHQTYPMLIETLAQAPISQSPFTQTDTQPLSECAATEKMKQILEHLHKEIDAGCFISIDGDQKKRYQSRCQIQMPRARKTFYTIAGLRIELSDASKKLKSSEKKQHELAKLLSNLGPKSLEKTHLEQDLFSLKSTI